VVAIERHGVRKEKKRRRVIEFLTAVGVAALAFLVWFGVVALLR
jgi:hypothetical protein